MGRVKTIILTRNTIIGEEGEVKTEERYFISSLPLGIEEIARSVGGHWLVESYHWHLDVTFCEDGNKALSLKKKRFAIGTNPEKHLEQIMNF